MATITLSVKPMRYGLQPVYPRQEWLTQTGERYVNSIGGSRWRLNLRFRVGEDERAALLADLTALMEADGYWRIPLKTLLGYRPKGTVPSTTNILVPANISGDSAVTGWSTTASDTTYLERGDIVSLYGELKVLRGRVSRAGTMRFWPAMRNTSPTVPGLTALEHVDPTGRYYLVGEPPPVLFRPLARGQMIEFALTLEEG